eukprot:scaffold1317_cov348-Prasinococcus_capsulatus_cf.AAC.7
MGGRYLELVDLTANSRPPEVSSDGRRTCISRAPARPAEAGSFTLFFKRTLYKPLSQYLTMYLQPAHINTSSSIIGVPGRGGTGGGRDLEYTCPSNTPLNNVIKVFCSLLLSLIRVRSWGGIDGCGPEGRICGRGALVALQLSSRGRSCSSSPAALLSR